ncbi:MULTISPECIES: MerR family transcriptional regulator [Clostridium]|uniref:helix-turn-helix domain-containing protein n=1 Tax=Clostridium TaxID=1485 RepID=UPI0008260812|nr:MULTISPECIES: MerR family transcriptional regulator [Clostridium]PJI06835.1 MerR family transcriptional regulator [Clostridium sp. CT7]
MANQIKISDFVKLTGSTLKTVLYYHKIGLLKEPKRSDSGYRLYGAEELSRMRMIKHLKNLGLSLKQIKEILKDANDETNLNEVLKALQTGLLKEKKRIEDQLSKIQTLLKSPIVTLEKTPFESEAFKTVTNMLETTEAQKQIHGYTKLFEQQRNIFGIIEDFKWGKDYKNNFIGIAEYFKLHPEKYKIALEFGKRLAKLKELSEDDPEVEALAREGADFIKNIPLLKEKLCNQTGFEMTYENLLNELTDDYLSPSQKKHRELIQKYLNYEGGTTNEK